MNDNEEISFDDFAKMDFRVGKFVSVEPIEGSEKLYKEIVDFGKEIGQRQILSGIKAWYKPEDLVGHLAIFIVNLAPRKIMGLESQGMLLAVDGDNGPILLTAPNAVIGAKVR